MTPFAASLAIITLGDRLAAVGHGGRIAQLIRGDATKRDRSRSVAPLSQMHHPAGAAPGETPGATGVNGHND